MGTGESDAESEARMVTQAENDGQQPPPSLNAKDQNHVVSNKQLNIKENGDSMKVNKRKLVHSDETEDDSDEEDFAGFDADDTKLKSGNFSEFFVLNLFFMDFSFLRLHSNYIIGEASEEK